MTTNARLLSKAKTYAVILIVSGITAIGCFLCVTVAYSRYKSVPFPSPAPYPGSVVKELWHRFRDSGGDYESNWLEYDVEQSITEMENYYSGEMRRYCASGWVFEDTNAFCDMDGYAGCRMAKCEIARSLAKEAQFFAVYLRPISHERINVLYRETYSIFIGR